MKKICVLWVGVVLLCAACGGISSDPDGGAGSADASRSPDVAGAPDVAVAPDAAPAGDLAKLTELLEGLAIATTDAQRENLVDAFFMDVAYSGGFPIRAASFSRAAAYSSQPWPVRANWYCSCMIPTMSVTVCGFMPRAVSSFRA